jgi:hypothetical protein
MTSSHSWTTGHNAWSIFTQTHPELGYRDGRQQFYNFLRRNRAALVDYDALRLAKGRFWVAHKERFCRLAFVLATGKHLQSNDSPELLS